jgi:peroxidase
MARIVKGGFFDSNQTFNDDLNDFSVQDLSVQLGVQSDFSFPTHGRGSGGNNGSGSHHPSGSSGVQFRSVDGSGNSLSHPAFNEAGTDFTRDGPAHFADGVDAMVSGPNPRTISNVVVAGDGDLVNPEGLSGMMYAWGQFVDHDLDLANADGTTNIGITVPADDPVLPPGSTIPLTRVNIDPATGHDGKPATAINSVTGWLDASMVYGSDQATATSLRTADGHMKTSAGDNLPIVNGMFAAGDARAQENPDLTALQTLFVREHNYQVDKLHTEHPNWSGDQLYQQARAIVTGEIENITYSEFLPHLLGPNAIEPYHGYNSHVDPRITEEFSGAAYRFGHSIVSAELTKFGEQGQTLADQDLKDAFFEAPATFESSGGADSLLRHLTSDASNALDVHIVDDLRNFLDAPPDAMDLAAINIQRGRDMGLGTLNETRESLGLTPYTSFDQITHDQATVQALKVAYNGDINSVDLWTGGLAEDHMSGAMVGQTFGVIIGQQFENLRDGDRFWFQNQGFDAKTLSEIQHTTLSDIIERDTDTQNIQPDAFVFYDRHSGTAGAIASEDPTAPQLVVGSNGHDTLVGGPKNDILVAGSGKQTLTGMGGSDTFVFDQKAINATITDFTPGVDKLKFENLSGLSLRDVHISHEHGNLVVTVGDDHVTLAGVNAHLLKPQDFVV